MTDVHCRQLAKTRGLDETFFIWLRQMSLVGVYSNSPAFPISGLDGSIVGCHVCLGGKRWKFVWFTNDEKLQVVTPLVLGNASTAAWAFVFESQWDGFAVAAAYEWQSRSDLANGCFVMTRGAEGGRRLTGLLAPTCCLYAWKQNDPPTGDRKVPAADKWLGDVSKHAGCEVRVVKTPDEHHDPNDWWKAGASCADFGAAVEAATPVAASTEEAKKQRPVPPDWGELGLVVSGQEERRPFPTHALPPPYCDMVRQVAEINRVPEGLAAMVALAAISASLGLNLAARLFQNLLTRGNLFVLGVVESGEGKSVTFAPLFRAIMDMQLALRDRWRREIWPQAKARKDTLKKQIEHLQGRAKHPKSDAETQQCVDQIAAKEAELDRLEVDLLEPTIVVEDITTEMLAVVMAQNQETCALVSSDGGDVVANVAGRYRRNQAVDDNLYVKAYSGDPVSVNRLNRPSVCLRSPCLSMMLLVQPDKLKRLLGNQKLIDGGFLPRFLMSKVSCRPAHVGADPVEIASETARAYQSSLTSLVETFRLAKEPLVIGATQVARQAIADYHNRVADRRAADLRDISSFAARWHEQACRLAVVLHATKYGASAGQHELDESTATAAIEIAEWFASEQMAILMAGRAEGLEMTFTAIWRLAQTSGGLTVRDLQRHHIMEDSAQATPLLSLLVQRGILSPEEQQTGGRPKTVYKLATT